MFIVQKESSLLPFFSKTRLNILNSFKQLNTSACFKTIKYLKAVKPCVLNLFIIHFRIYIKHNIYR